MEFLFFMAICIIAHGYGAYALPILLFKKREMETTTINSSSINYKAITVIIAAYNEERIIKQKIENTLSLNYPKDKLEIIIVTDGSTDNTYAIAKQYEKIRCFHEPNRSGKMSAIDRVMPFVTNEISVFTDANTMLNDEALKYINLHFSNNNVGGVAGEKKVASIATNHKELPNQEGVYWKYESWLKRIDSSFYSVVGAAGELYAIRTNLYKYPGNNIVLDDFIISMNICKQGYVFKYEPNAFATEYPSLNINEERKRKIRIAAGGIQSIILLRSLFKFWNTPKLSYLFISHRVLRWSIIPYLFVLIFFTNLYLVLYTDSLCYKLFFIIQCLFYSLSILGYYITKYERKITVLNIPYYIVFMNINQIKGMLKFINGTQSAVWDKAKRIGE